MYQQSTNEGNDKQLEGLVLRTYNHTEMTIQLL